MTQITDINMLRHHRVNYGPRIDREMVRPRKRAIRSQFASIIVLALLPILTLVLFAGA